MSRIRFNRKPMPLIADYRPLYKIFQILTILHYNSRGGKSSLIRLHLINWILKSEERKKQLSTFEPGITLPFKVWGIDPALNFALQYSVAQNLVARSADTYSITPEGKALLNQAKKQDAEYKEAEYLRSIGKRMTEQMVTEIVEKWN